MLAVVTDNNNIIKMAFRKVTGIYRSTSVEPFIVFSLTYAKKGTKTQAAALEKLRATEHHTFPMCESSNAAVAATVAAIELKVGDCLRTVHGRATIKNVARSPASQHDKTYTIVVEGQTELIAVGGIFTHAKAEHGHAVAPKKVLHVKGRPHMLRGTY